MSSLYSDVTVKTGSGRAAEARSGDGRFWLAELAKDGATASVHERVVPWAKTLRQCWRPLAQRDLEHDRIYENRTLRYGARYLPALSALESIGYDTARLFVTTSIVDTFVARISKRRSMPMFVVDDAEWDLKQKAHDFRRWLHGKMLETAVDRLWPGMVRDACVRGDGVLYVDDTDDDIIVERVHRSELLIDPYEAKQGAPAVRTIYRLRQVSRDALIAQWPEYAAQIEQAPEAMEDPLTRRADLLSDETMLGRRDIVDFFEAWHLPSCDDADEDETDGRVAACLDGATLCYAPWTSPRFPFARLSRYPSQTGYWGRGDVEMLRGSQAELNRMVADISQNVHVTGKGIWMAPMAAQVQPEQLSGYRPFVLQTMAGTAPQFVHPPPVGPATIDLLERKIGWMHDLIGVAQWAAQGRSPLGNGVSGVAIDTMEDLLSDRHSTFEDAAGHARLDIAQGMLDAGQRLQARWKAEGARDADDKRRRRKLGATWMDKGSIKRLDWDDVALKGEEYRLQLEPVNFLPSTRAGKLAMTAELVGKGVIPQEYASTLYEEPDVAHINREVNAERNNVQRMMEQAGRLDRPLPNVEEWHPLDMLLASCKRYFNRSQAEGAPPEVETRYRDLGDMVQLLIDQLHPPAPPGPPPGGPGMPAGGPPPGLPPGPDMGAPPPGAEMPPGPPMDPSMMLPPGAA